MTSSKRVSCHTYSRWSCCKSTLIALCLQQQSCPRWNTSSHDWTIHNWSHGGTSSPKFASRLNYCWWLYLLWMVHDRIWRVKVQPSRNWIAIWISWGMDRVDPRTLWRERASRCRIDSRWTFLRSKPHASGRRDPTIVCRPWGVERVGCRTFL